MWKPLDWARPVSLSVSAGTEASVGSGVGETQSGNSGRTGAGSLRGSSVADGAVSGSRRRLNFSEIRKMQESTGVPSGSSRPA